MAKGEDVMYSTLYILGLDNIINDNIINIVITFFLYKLYKKKKKVLKKLLRHLKTQANNIIADIKLLDFFIESVTDEINVVRLIEDIKINDPKTWEDILNKKQQYEVDRSWEEILSVSKLVMNDGPSIDIEFVNLVFALIGFVLAVFLNNMETIKLMFGNIVKLIIISVSLIIINMISRDISKSKKKKIEILIQIAENEIKREQKRMQNLKNILN